MKQTFTFTHANGNTYTKGSSVKVFTHVVLWEKEGKSGVFSWHISEQHAEKEITKIRNCVGRDFYKDHVLSIAEVAA